MADKDKLPVVKIGVIGGSGVYEIEGIKNLKEYDIPTPFGKTSDTIIVGELGGVPCAFLPRHGRGHRISPSEVNSRANIYAMKAFGVERIIAVSACGSLKEEIEPGDFLIPDQLFDRTRERPRSFFGEGIVGHVGFAEPYCKQLSELLFAKSRELGIKSHLGGTYVCIEGPMFSTKAESKVWRGMGFSIVGMTNLPEARLAREAEICFTTVGLVTDYDVWKEGEEVTVEKVVATITKNVANVKKLLKALVGEIKPERDCACKDALRGAIMTAPEAIDKKTSEKLKLIIGKYI
ncbi:MAG: S-methyl-5'-thioadenosine phosphorylase [Elusimicrobia bacterium HGW-Elusimicrobia-1]|jgi:5'-methylthioadenosine phosphorylase|nr:MAG: S-methyl-5'-thioadenosine phosphorylase [Elusimicrobia bacterium HGW-Elusimicrobia-1]